MISIQNGSTTAVIVVHEIYGLNQHIQDICTSLSEQGCDVFCPDLLGRPAFDYVEENEAYRYFMESIGFSHAQREVEELLANVRAGYDKVIILGFSVGATIAWLCSEDERIDGVVGYYGSRIRQFLELRPTCPVLLFFPQRESSFDVNQLMVTLRKKNTNTSLYQFQGEHGFSDPYSTRFNEVSSEEAFRIMVGFIKEL